jgi:hypothetical protein
LFSSSSLSSSSSPPASGVHADIFEDIELDQVEFLAPRLKSSVSNYARFKWAFSDKGKLQTLIEKLGAYNEDLYKITERHIVTTPVQESGGSLDKFRVQVELPFPPNLDFCGREDILELMRRFFQTTNGKTKREVIVCIPLSCSSVTNLVNRFCIG